MEEHTLSPLQQLYRNWAIPLHTHLHHIWIARALTSHVFEGVIRIRRQPHTDPVFGRRARHAYFAVWMGEPLRCGGTESEWEGYLSISLLVSAFPILEDVYVYVYVYTFVPSTSVLVSIWSTLTKIRGRILYRSKAASFSRSLKRREVN